jgi:hypothetical protein
MLVGTFRQTMSAPGMMDTSYNISYSNSSAVFFDSLGGCCRTYEYEYKWRCSNDTLYCYKGEARSKFTFTWPRIPAAVRSFRATSMLHSPLLTDCRRRFHKCLCNRQAGESCSVEPCPTPPPQHPGLPTWTDRMSWS